MPKGAINAKIKAITKNTLLIFDEIQECPNIISSLKYFCQNHREIPVIATGSMVRIKIKRNNNKRGAGEQKEFLFPVGKIDEMTLYPMTFDEFLMNTNELLYNKVFESWEKKLPLDNQIHQMVMDYVYRYLLIGGMPEIFDCIYAT